MEKKDIRVLALDLDGTLTNDQKVVTPATRTALDAAAAKGVTIVLASGRPTAGVVPLARELELDKKGGCILSYNGGSITDTQGWLIFMNVGALFNYVARVFSAGSSIVNNVKVIVTTIEALNNFKLTGKN